MRCPSCGFENPEGMNFCEECGTKLARVCPSCGHEVRPAARVCGNCAASLITEVQSPRSQVPSPGESEVRSPKSEVASTQHPIRS
ncbi:MAG TPA: zinc-ribbon domain-containing protein [Candidatus Binatia bacterium]|nr:zinc-ribbon domain-containing protein [Candidatus Binatia bacterium]